MQTAHCHNEKYFLFQLFIILLLRRWLLSLSVVRVIEILEDCLREIPAIRPASEKTYSPNPGDTIFNSSITPP
jgi:hypothetical protein